MSFHPVSDGFHAEKRWLQAAVLIAGLVPVAGGLAGVVMGAKLLDATAPDVVSFDSHSRYLSGLLLGVGLAFWSLVPVIERAGAVFKVLACVVIIGGLARLAGLMAIGVPSPIMLLALVMELIVTPLLWLWQVRLERRVSTP